MQEGVAPLHEAADNGKYKFAKLLLDKGANPNVQRDDGETPLSLACDKGDERLTALLLYHHASPNIPNHTVRVTKVL